MENDINQDRGGLEQFIDLLEKSLLVAKENNGELKKFNTAEDLYLHLTQNSTIPSDKLTEVYAKYKGVPFIRIQEIDPKALSLIDKQTALTLGFIPFFLDEKDNILQIAITDPIKFKLLNKFSISQLEKKLGYKLEFFIASSDQIKSLINKPRGEKTIDLLSVDVSSDLIKKLPPDIAEEYNLVIFRKNEDKSYDLAVADPTDVKTKEIITTLEGNGELKLNVFKAPVEQIKQLLSSEKKSGPESVITNVVNQQPPQEKPQKVNVSALSESIEESDLAKLLGKDKVTVEDVKNFANTDQIPKLVGGILMLAVEDRASDVHIEPFEKNIRVRFRVDGELNDVLLIPSIMNANIVARIKILSKLKLDEQRIPQDGRFDVHYGVNAVDIRVSTLPTVFGEKVVMRLLSKNKDLDKLEDLGLDGLGYDKLVEAIGRPYGVVLSTGPTGSGKTTTLYSILSRLNRPEVNIITLEDPVEYELTGINQVQVKPQIGFSFAEGLRSVLRQDPNVVMVGEIRDSETAELVTHAALTGHLVLSTLHTNDAPSALPRLFNLGVEPFLLTSAVNAIIGQRLVRKICQKCKEEVSVPQSVVFQVKKELESLNISTPIKFFKGKGCSECKQGFSGRIGLFEVLTMSKQIEDLVIEKKTASEIRDQAVKEGMVTMRQDGLMKVIKGLTTIDEVMQATNQAKEG